MGSWERVQTFTCGEREYEEAEYVSSCACVPYASDDEFKDAITLVYLPNGPVTYFKLTSIELTKQIYVGRFWSALEKG